MSIEYCEEQPRQRLNVVRVGDHRETYGIQIGENLTNTITENELCVEEAYLHCDDDAVENGPTAGIAYEEIGRRM